MAHQLVSHIECYRMMKIYEDLHGLPMFTMINGCFTGKHGGFERKDGGVTGKNDDFLATFGDLSMTRKVV